MLRFPSIFLKPCLSRLHWPSATNCLEFNTKLSPYSNWFGFLGTGVSAISSRLSFGGYTGTSCVFKHPEIIRSGIRDSANSTLSAFDRLSEINNLVSPSSASFYLSSYVTFEMSYIRLMAVMADGWYEWKKDIQDAKVKTALCIYHESKQPIFFAAIGRYHPDEAVFPDDSGLVIVTAASDSWLLDIHDRRPAVLPPVAAREWMVPQTTPARAEELATGAATPPDDFTWHPVGKSVGNIRNDNAELREPISNPLV